MTGSPTPSFAHFLGHRLRWRAPDLARSWLDGLLDLYDEPARRIFPTESLLNSIPQLLDRLAQVLLAAGEEALEDDFVDRELELLASLRRQQGYSVAEVIHEFELLGDQVHDHVLGAAREYPDPLRPEEVLETAHRLQSALLRLPRGTARHYEAGESSDRLDRARALQEFSRNVTHELRNRLNAASISLALLREVDRDDDENFQALMATLDRSLGRATEVATDVFAVALAQGRPAPVEGRRQSLRDLIAELVEDARELASDQGVEIRVQRAIPDLQIDAARVQLAVANLVGNAIKYSDPSREPSWVEIRAGHLVDEKEIQIDVTDNGIGISGERRERIFQANDRVPEAKTREGEGLGLAIARDAMNQLGGQLTVSDRGVGPGSIFSICFPEPRQA